MGVKQEDYILEVKDLCKVYMNGVYAGNHISFSLKRGEIHALVGENGAGKTTLMKLLYGMETPDQGEILVNGERVEITSPNVAIAHGICMVHQHFMLIPSFTAAENIAIGFEPGSFGRYDKKKAVKTADELAQKYRFQVKAEEVVENLPVGLKQKVEILKALNHGAKVLILDEPTAVLTPQETVELFEQLRLLRDEGHTIIFISHKLKEVKQISDRISVMRKGRLVKTWENSEDLSIKEISEEMIGRGISSERLKKPVYHGENQGYVLTVEGLSCKNEHGKEVLSNLTFAVKAGEIVGIAGVEGNGQNELAQILGGMQAADSGSVRVLGTELLGTEVSDIRKAGLVYIPADRMQYGMAAEAGIWENLISTKGEDTDIFTKGLRNAAGIRAFTEQMIQEYEILAESGEQEIGMLSGGNMQKVIVAREFSNCPRMIVAEQPTRGIDVGAAELIHKRLVELSREGCGVILISADLDEILKVSDRILVMYGGTFTGVFENSGEIDEIMLGEYMLGVKRMEGPE